MFSVGKFFLSLSVLIVHPAFNNAQSTSMNLIPFSLELYSNSNSRLNDIENELVYRTEEHLEKIIESRDDAAWVNVKNVDLSIEEHSLAQDEDMFKSTTKFVGTIEILDSTLTTPDIKEIEDLQWDAFVGQSKLDYLSNVVNKSSDDFLMGVTDVQLNWTPLKKKTNYVSILWSCAIGIIVAIVLIAGYLYHGKIRKCMSPSTSRQKNKRVKHSKLRNEESHIIELAETGSISPANASVNPTYFDDTASDLRKNPMTPGSRDTFDVRTNTDMLDWKQGGETGVIPFSAADISRISKSDAQTAITRGTKGTVDMNNSTDMLAWKHKNSNSPFNADITEISNTSPNKTLHIDPKTFVIEGKKLRNKADPKYLSSNMLSEHNEYSFKDHAKRYAEKMKPKHNSEGSNRL